MPRDDEQDERDRRDPPNRPGRSGWMDGEDARRGSDAEYERRYPHQKKGMPVWAILAIVIGSILAVGCVGGVLMAMLGWTAARPPTPPPAPPPPVVVPAEGRP